MDSAHSQWNDRERDRESRDLITEFLAQVDVADSTRVKYRAHLDELRAWFNDPPNRSADEAAVPISMITPADLHRFMGHLRSPERLTSCGAPLSPGTRKTYVASLRTFFGYLVAVQIITTDPTSSIRPPHVPAKRGMTLSADELRRLLDARGTERERMIVYLLVYTAARSGEVRLLKWHDIDFVSRTILLHGKNGKVRALGIHPRLMSELRRWFLYQEWDMQRNAAVRDARSNADTDFVLLTRTGKPLSAGAVFKQVKRRATTAGLHVLDPGHREHRSLVSPHALRRSFATLMLNEGHHLDAVADVLGHASVDTTRKHYAFASNARTRATINAFDI